jgi:NitT/TauT family transport system substrate-binding protein
MTLISLAQAREAGIDIKMAGPPAAWSTGVPGDDFVAVFAKPDSGIASAADLAGKTVATNTLAGVGPTVIRNSVAVHGGDPAEVEFVEVGFGEMMAALESGQVDAIWLPEPFITMAEEAGFVPVAWPYQDVSADSFPEAFLVTTGEFAENNPEVYDAFTAAYAEALAYAAANEDEVRAILPAFTGLSPELAEAITMPKFAPATFSIEQLQPMADVIYNDGLVSEPLNLDEFLIAP